MVQQRLSRVLGMALVLLGALAGAMGQQVFTERFEGAQGQRWTVGPTADQPGVRWSTGEETPGLHFATQGRGYAYAPWAVGTQAFELSWQTEITRGMGQAWREPGVYVALASAPPDQMTAKDIAILFAIHCAGVSASVKGGETFSPNKVALHAGAPPYCRFEDRELSPRYALNQGGAGGHFYSVQWPQPRLNGTRLAFRITRSETHDLHFTVYHQQYEEGTEPWWQKSWRLPANVAQVPLQYVVVQTILRPQDYPKAPNGILPEYLMTGWVRNIQGRLVPGPVPPAVTGYTSTDAVLREGSTVTLQGEGLVRGTTVRIGGKAVAVISVNDRELRITLPALPSDQRHALLVTSPEGLTTEVPGGIPYGRFLERLEPREAHPRGGDIVTVVGGGFSRETTIRFAGKPATVVSIQDASHIKVRVPAGTPGPAAVTAEAGKAAFAGTPLFGYAPHPYLYFHEEELADLRKKFNEPMFANYRNRLLALADRISPENAQTEKSGLAGINDLLWAYLLTSEAKYKTRLMQLVQEESRSLVHTEFRTMAAGDMAQVYDALFAELTLDERLRLERYLERASRVYADRVKAGDWWYANDANPSNTIAVGAGGGGVAGMALLHSTPVAREAAEGAANAVQRHYQAMSPDGGCTEGTLYWNYGLTWYLRFAHALKNATGTDRGLLDTPALRRNYRFVETQLGGDGRFFTFNDTQPWLTGLAVCADLGSRFHQPLMLWLADQMVTDFAGEKRVYAENARGDILPFAFLWRSREPAPAAFPGVPTCTALETMQWGVLRASGAFQPSLVVGVKGQGGQVTHHAQPDAGSFVLHARGEAYLIDPGYYQGTADAHSLPLINGQGPQAPRGEATPAPITAAWEGGPWRGMTVEATRTYPKAAGVQRVRRHIVLYGEQAVIMLDDIVPAQNAPAQVTAQYQAGFTTQVQPDGRSAIITGKAGQLLLRTFGPALTLETPGPRAFGNSWIFNRLAEIGEVQWHRIAGTYQADAAQPLVTVCLLAALDKPFPTVAVRQEGDTLTIHLSAGAQLVFQRTPEGWQVVRPSAATAVLTREDIASAGAKKKK